MKFILFISFCLPLGLFAGFNFSEIIQSHPQATHLIMIRHGETYRNATGKQIVGWVDDEAAQLTHQGHSQAEQAGKLLFARYPHVAAIYSSPLGRCKATASHILQNYSTIPLIEDRRFIEICHGQHDTMSNVERNSYCLQRYLELEMALKETHPDQSLDRFFKWKVNPLAERAIPSERKEHPFKGELETIFQVFNRTTEACAEIAKKHPGGSVIIATHQVLLKCLADEAEFRERGDLSPLPVYFEKHNPSDKAHSQFLPGYCACYHFLWNEGTLSFLGAENLLE